MDAIQSPFSSDPLALVLLPPAVEQSDNDPKSKETTKKINPTESLQLKLLRRLVGHQPYHAECSFPTVETLRPPPATP